MRHMPWICCPAFSADGRALPCARIGRYSLKEHMKDHKKELALTSMSSAFLTDVRAAGVQSKWLLFTTQFCTARLES